MCDFCVDLRQLLGNGNPQLREFSKIYEQTSNFLILSIHAAWGGGVQPRFLPWHGASLGYSDPDIHFNFFRGAAEIWTELGAARVDVVSLSAKVLWHSGYRAFLGSLVWYLDKS